jgi:HK97 family phage portal protein
MSRKQRRYRTHPAFIEEKALDSATFPTELLAPPTLSGTSITPEIALSVPAVANAVSLISGAIGTLPLYLYREEGQGKALASDHPSFDRIALDANDWTSSSALRTQLAIDALLHGDGFALANRLPNGDVYELIRLMPKSVTVLYDPATSEPVYRWNPAPSSSDLGETAQVMPVSLGESPREFTYKDIIHVTAPLSVNGITGIAPIAHAREAIGLALVLEQYAARLFGRGARPSGVLAFDQKLDAATAARMKASWQSAHGGANSGGTAVIEAGGKFQPITLNSVDAQFLEMRQFAIVEIARAFGLSPVMIGDASRATWTNAEQYNLQFLSYALGPWLRCFEAAYRRVMLSSDERKRFTIEFDTSELLRGDSKARAEFIAKLRAAGVLTANEARSFESLPTHPDGDKLDNPYTTSGNAESTPQSKAAS